MACCAEIERIAVNDHQKAHLETVGPMYSGIVRKAYEGEASPRAAIKAFCLYCTGYDRATVADCTSFACPLHPYRPYQPKKGEISAEGSEISLPETTSEEA